jgi:hypothetical protein
MSHIQKPKDHYKQIWPTTNEASVHPEFGGIARGSTGIFWIFIAWGAHLGYSRRNLSSSHQSYQSEGRQYEAHWHVLGGSKHRRGPNRNMALSFFFSLKCGVGSVFFMHNVHVYKSMLM